MRARSNQEGGVALEALLEFLLVLIIVPPLVSCALQLVLTLANIVVPWIALVLIVFIVAAAVAVIASAHPRDQGVLDDGSPRDLPALPPIDRPNAPRMRGEDDGLR